VESFGWSALPPPSADWLLEMMIWRPQSQESSSFHRSSISMSGRGRCHRSLIATDTGDGNSGDSLKGSGDDMRRGEERKEEEKSNLKINQHHVEVVRYFEENSQRSLSLKGLSF
jgi:hypothetical protein